MNLPPLVATTAALLDAERTPHVLREPDALVNGAAGKPIKQRVLAIDSDRAIAELVKHGLSDFGYEVETETGGKRAIDRVQTEIFDAIIVDIQLGAVTGIELLRSIRENDQQTAIILLSKLRDSEAVLLAMHNGADDFITKPFDIVQLHECVARAIVRRGTWVGHLREQRKLTDALRESHDEILQREMDLESLTIRSIRSLVLSLEAKDAYTKDHSIKVAQLSLRIAKQLGLPERVVREVRLAGLLHDVGKIGVRESVLNKPGKLNDDELEHMRRHPLIGARILLPLSHRFPEIVSAVKFEHERVDGKGYPTGIGGKDIPLAARIIAVADCHDAITSNRPYRGAQLREFAAREIAAGSGTQFDPEVVTAFLELVPTL
ncbi:MAG: response regulator [Planctomycetes bacterium]|nr:response regulator [Planctomycetota bacterium]